MPYFTLMGKNIMQIASAKLRSAKGASHQPPFMGTCLTRATNRVR